jgi:hypothetical protein
MAKTAAWTRKEGKDGKTCTKCGEDQPVANFYTDGKKVDGSPKYNSWCKSCIKTKMSSYHTKTWGPEKLQRTAFKRTKSNRAYLAYLRAKAVARGGNCLSLNDLEELWNLQHGLCAVTGWPLTYTLGQGRIPTNCSIDRIDSSKPYIAGNVQLVCTAVNIAKSDLPIELFIDLCRSVVEKQDGKIPSMAA